jgi:hypothetical protein
MSQVAYQGKRQRMKKAKERQAQSAQAEPVANVKPKKSKYRSRKGVGRNTALYRQRKVEEVQAKKALGVDSKPTPAQQVQVYEDYPVLEGAELDQEMRQLSPTHDENLGPEFWTMVGMESTGFMNHLPVPRRQTVDPMELLDQG